MKSESPNSTTFEVFKDCTELDTLKEKLQKDEHDKMLAWKQQWNSRHKDYLNHEACMHCKNYRQRFSCGRPVAEFCDLSGYNVDGTSNHCDRFEKVKPKC